MLVRNPTNAFCFGVLLVFAAPVLAQVHGPPEQILADPVKAPQAAVLDEIHFAGLRRIAPEAVTAQIATHPGDRFDPARVAKDVRALARLGWFESIRVEATPSAESSSQLPEDSKYVTLIFHLSEFPFLSKAEYSGSRLLSQKQIDKLLEEKKLAPGLGKPADPAALQRIALAIRVALNELGHPAASVRIAREEASNATVTVRFETRLGNRSPRGAAKMHTPAKHLKKTVGESSPITRTMAFRKHESAARQSLGPTNYRAVGFPGHMSRRRLGSPFQSRSRRAPIIGSNP